MFDLLKSNKYDEVKIDMRSKNAFMDIKQAKWSTVLEYENFGISQWGVIKKWIHLSMHPLRIVRFVLSACAYKINSYFLRRSLISPSKTSSFEGAGGAAGAAASFFAIFSFMLL